MPDFLPSHPQIYWPKDYWTKSNSLKCISEMHKALKPVPGKPLFSGQSRQRKKDSTVREKINVESKRRTRVDPLFYLA